MSLESDQILHNQYKYFTPAEDTENYPSPYFKILSLIQEVANLKAQIVKLQNKQDYLLELTDNHSKQLQDVSTVCTNISAEEQTQKQQKEGKEDGKEDRKEGRAENRKRNFRPSFSNPKADCSDGKRKDQNRRVRSTPKRELREYRLQIRKE